MSSLKSSPSSGKFSLSTSLKSLFMGRHTEVANIGTASLPLYFEAKYLEASMISGSLAKFVKLPVCVSRNEWLATHIFDFGSMILDLWEAVMEAPTVLKRSKSEPCLQNFPCNYQKQEAMISWLQEQINVLPARSGSTEMMYAANFEQTTVKSSFGVFYVNSELKIFVDLLSFIYGNFFDRIIVLKLESVLNSLFMHVVMFGKEFGLIGEEPLEDLYKALACRHLRHYSTAP